MAKDEGMTKEYPIARSSFVLRASSFLLRKSVARLSYFLQMKLFARSGPKKKKRGKLFRYGWKITLLAIIAAGGISVFLFYGAWSQTFDMKKVGEMPERNTVLDVDGKIYSRLAGANRLKVSLSEVSPLFIAAGLAREDTRFYKHGGIDCRGILLALLHDILSHS